MSKSEEKLVYFITHPEVNIDPNIPVPEWSLSSIGIERFKNMLKKDWVKDIKSIYSSKEQKSIDGAEILSQFLSLKYKSIKELGENDRSSTGFLHKEKFEEMVNKFFSNPQISIHGWESASDAQERIVKIVKNIIKEEKQFPIAIISHGGVAGLLLCYIKKCEISINQDQPGEGGGNYFVFNADTFDLIQDWNKIDTFN